MLEHHERLLQCESLMCNTSYCICFDSCSLRGKMVIKCV